MYIGSFDMPSAFFGFTGGLDDWNLAWLSIPVKSGVMIPPGVLPYIRYIGMWRPKGYGF